jgi:hypothetical protein
MRRNAAALVLMVGQTLLSVHAAAAPGGAALHLALGKSHAAAGAPVSARAQLEKARSSSDSAIRAMAEFWMDLMENKGVSPVRAIETARRHYIERDDFDGAVRQMESLLTRFPMDERLHRTLGNLYVTLPQFCIEPPPPGRKFTYQSVPYAALHEFETASHLAKTPQEKIAAEAALAKLYMERVREFRALARCEPERAITYISSAQDYAARARWKLVHVRELQAQHGIEGVPRAFSMAARMDNLVREGIAIVHAGGSGEKTRNIMRELRNRNQRLFNPDPRQMPSIFLIPLGETPPSPASGATTEGP